MTDLGEKVAAWVLGRVGMLTRWERDQMAAREAITEAKAAVSEVRTMSDHVRRQHGTRNGHHRNGAPPDWDDLFDRPDGA